MKLQMQQPRCGGTTPGRYHRRSSASIRIGWDGRPAQGSDNNELLAADTVGNLSQPTSRLPPRPARLIMIASLRPNRSASGFKEDATTLGQLRALSRVSIKPSYQKGEANEDIRRRMDKRVIAPTSPRCRDFLAPFGGTGRSTDRLLLTPASRFAPPASPARRGSRDR
jgi:hypothetical protein